MRHFIPELWLTAAALAAGRAALDPRLGRYTLPLLGVTFLAGAAAFAAAPAVWLLSRNGLR